ncbi:MAG: c-type cytochrome [candidate division NC10 bacterium]|nr:c-type cytochrome [candidate division NC10 bacterium]MBI2455643.1 c-type cytochrome [candidate division NC10 bacterium]
MVRTSRLGSILLAGLVGAGVVALAAAQQANIANGKEKYLEHCASCHGKEGKGDGPDAKDLNPKPRNHTDGNVMNRLRDNYLFTVVKNGGQAVGKSDQMPGWGNILSDQDITDVIAFVRTLAKPPYKPTR